MKTFLAAKTSICYSLTDKLYDSDQVFPSTMWEEKTQVCMTCGTSASHQGGLPCSCTNICLLALEKTEI